MSDRFENTYRSGVAPWDIGRPQPAFVRIAESVQSPVIDVGCGTGENALHLAALGHDVLGIDIAPRAIEMAREKSELRGVAARFQVLDALALDTLGETFETVIDSAVFHVFEDPERVRYERALASIVRPGGRIFVLVFSEHEPAEWGGPRRVSQAEIRSTFSDGWRIESIEADRMHTNFHEAGGHAWFASIRRA